MAIIKRPSGKYQVKFRGIDGRWISKSFLRKQDAEDHELRLKQEKILGGAVTNSAQNLTLDQFFEHWIESIRGSASEGWVKTRRQQYRHFVQPYLGKVKLKLIQPPAIAKVLGKMAAIGRSEQSRLHVFSLLRKMFKDAGESFRLISFNPVLLTYKPHPIEREALHLNLDQMRLLLTYCRYRPYGAAIWIQFYLGLRCGELQALRWQDIDLDRRWVYIRRTYVRKELVFRDFPKGKKQHSNPIPPELIPILEDLYASRGESDLVVRSIGYHMLSYEWYHRTLLSYCAELKIPAIGTHGLRHTTSTLYMSAGASRDEIRELFAHSSERMTERYVHGRDSTLGKKAQTIRLFPKSSQSVCSPDVPRSPEMGAGAAG